VPMRESSASASARARLASFLPALPYPPPHPLSVRVVHHAGWEVGATASASASCSWLALHPPPPLCAWCATQMGDGGPGHQAHALPQDEDAPRPYQYSAGAVHRGRTPGGSNGPPTRYAAGFTLSAPFLHSSLPPALASLTCRLRTLPLTAHSAAHLLPTMPL